mgnify:CR=1 FL=1
MGFIPIFITLGGAVLLFILVVRQGINSKKSQFNQFCNETWKGLLILAKEETQETPALDVIKLKYSSAKKDLLVDQEEYFENRIRKPFQQAKLVQSQHNKFISKKPWKNTILFDTNLDRGIIPKNTVNRVFFNRWRQ